MYAAELVRKMGADAIQALYNEHINDEAITVNETKPDFKGDYTIVTFGLTKTLRKNPQELGEQIGAWIMANHSNSVSGFNVIKGFLNISFADAYWLKLLAHSNNNDYGKWPANKVKVMVEYASPNTNKPLHLGHLRNIFLGWSMAEIYTWCGYDVMRTCVVNDRGVHICKSMLAWKMYADGATPESVQQKGDHFVGDYYVKFENELRRQATPLLEALLKGNVEFLQSEADQQKALALLARLRDAGLDEEKTKEINSELNELSRNATALMQEVRTMLLKWENGDEETLAVWKMMNGWVYEGFETTYQRIGNSFDKVYYESDTYLLGKAYVERGLKDEVFFRKEDGSIWINLEKEGLDEKLVLRKDGTSVYITQDIGLAYKKHDDYPMQESIYVIGDEQNYHMQVLQAICEKLKMPFAKGIHHLSYGMVELPGGRMKSREGTVVDADDLCDEMERVAAQKTLELGKVADFTEQELKQLYHVLGMGALKFYLLRVDARKRMVFNPEESIDFQGVTGPFIQYTFTRIRSILRKANADVDLPELKANTEMDAQERQMLVKLEQWPGIISEARRDMNPSLIANYAFGLAKQFNSFYATHSVAFAESDDTKILRIHLCALMAITLHNALGLLGIAAPHRM